METKQLRGAKATKRWNPKHWKPEYEAIVALAATGMPQGEIARRYGYTESWLSGILNCDQAKIIQQMIINRTREAALTSIPARLEALKDIAIKRVEDTLKNDEIYKRSPMAIFDRSFAFLKSGGTIGDGEPAKPSGHTFNVQQNNTLIVTPAKKEDLRESLRLAEEVKALHE